MVRAGRSAPQAGNRHQGLSRRPQGATRPPAMSPAACDHPAMLIRCSG